MLFKRILKKQGGMLCIGFIWLSMGISGGPFKHPNESSGSTSYWDFFLVFWGGVRLSPLGTSTNIWPFVQAPDDRWWLWSIMWNEDWQGNRSTRRKPAPMPLSPPQTPHWPDLGSNPGRRGGKTATNRLSCGTASEISSVAEQLLSS
jgi:hypothetical protein